MKTPKTKPGSRVWSPKESKNITQFDKHWRSEMSLDEHWNEVNSLLPEGSFLSDYLKFTSGQESPTLFHFWVGVGTIGGAAHREIFFDKAYYKVFCNHFICLVAPSGRCRKSSAIAIGVSLLKNLQNINVIARKITPEALIESLKVGSARYAGTKLEINCSGFIYAPELAVFIGKQAYNEGLIAILTDLADNPNKWEYKTRGKGMIELKNVNISMLGASTPDWLVEGIPSTAFGGGFMSRIIWVAQEDSPRSFPFPSLDDVKIAGSLVERLKQIQRVSGSFINDPKAIDWYKNWYKDLKTNYRTDDPKMSGYIERKPDHLIRLAMVLTLSEARPLVLTDETYYRALKLLNIVERYMVGIFIEVDAVAEGKDHTRLLAQIKRNNGKIAHDELLRMNYNKMGLDRFNKGIAMLVEAGWITRDKDSIPFVYRIN
jgi:hypothetical protein